MKLSCPSFEIFRFHVTNGFTKDLGEDWFGTGRLVPTEATEREKITNIGYNIGDAADVSDTVEVCAFFTFVLSVSSNIS